MGGFGWGAARVICVQGFIFLIKSSADGTGQGKKWGSTADPMSPRSCRPDCSAGPGIGRIFFFLSHSQCTTTALWWMLLKIDTFSLKPCVGNGLPCSWIAAASPGVIPVLLQQAKCLKGQHSNVLVAVKKCCLSSSHHWSLCGLDIGWVWRSGTMLSLPLNASAESLLARVLSFAGVCFLKLLNVVLTQLFVPAFL